MKKIKLGILRTYYQLISHMSDLTQLRFLTHHKILVGALILSFSVSSCSIFRPHRMCHKIMKPSSKKTSENVIKKAIHKNDTVQEMYDNSFTQK